MSTQQQRRAVDATDALMSAHRLPTYSQLVHTLRAFDRAESTSTDRHTRETRLAAAHQQARRQLALIDA